MLLGDSHLGSGCVQADVQQGHSQPYPGRCWVSGGTPATEGAWAHLDEVSQDRAAPLHKRSCCLSRPLAHLTQGGPWGEALGGGRPLWLLLAIGDVFQHSDASLLRFLDSSGKLVVWWPKNTVEWVEFLLLHFWLEYSVYSLGRFLGR